MIEKTNQHPEEVINHCIDNRRTFVESYVAIIDEKIANLDKGLHNLRRDVEQAFICAKFSKP